MSKSWASEFDTEKQAVMMRSMSLRKSVFWPPFALLMVAVLFSLVDGDRFLKTMTSMNTWILETFGAVFSWSTLFMLVTCVVVYFSRIGHVRIGGEKARPLLTQWRWFSITLCTTIAIGILFWASAEPLFHLHTPPVSMGLTANSEEAARFALSTMYMHWSFTPYAIYTVPALTFALVYYNLKHDFSLSSILAPLLGKRGPKSGSWFGSAVDAICLFALVAGMAASLGAGILTLLGAAKKYFGMTSTPFTIGFIALAVVGTFTASAASGLMKGIRILSDLNVKIFFGLCLFFFIFGPTGYILAFGAESFVEYVAQFFSRSTFTGDATGDPWPKSWTVFYWANWLAWAPITALFLGRISYGYTVRQFIRVNLFFPSLFGCFWMAVFSGTSLYHDQSTNGALYQQLQAQGAESVIYKLIETLPFEGLVTAFFVFASFLSYVTAADSNTEAMGGISMRGLDPKKPSPPVWVKFAWGATVGTVAWVMVSFAGLDGVKMLSNLGGLPALFLVLATTFALLRLVVSSQKLKLTD